MKIFALRENHLFRKAYAGGKKAGSRSISVYVLKDKHAYRLKKENPEKKTLNRVGISASKKIGGAVRRNRAKRVIREAYRALEKNIGIRKGFLIVIVAHEAATEVKMQDVYRDMQSCLARLGMLRSSEEQEEKAQET